MATKKKLDDNLVEEVAVETAAPQTEVIEDAGQEEVVETTETATTSIAGVDAAALATIVAQATANVMKGVTVAQDAKDDTSVQLNAIIKRRDGQRQAAARAYEQEEKILVSISPSYRPHLGKTAHASLNGISVYVPVDGRPYRVNKSHAALILSSIRKYDDQMLRGEKLGKINQNVEQRPGDIKF